jgi:hypothetical protein
MKSSREREREREKEREKEREEESASVRVKVSALASVMHAYDAMQSYMNIYIYASLYMIS